MQQQLNESVSFKNIRKVNDIIVEKQKVAVVGRKQSPADAAAVEETKESVSVGSTGDTPEQH